MKTLYIFLFPAFCLLLLSGCDLEKEIQVPLPAYENKLVVECYLEAGNPYRMTISESASYFAEPELPDVNYATATINGDGRQEMLKYDPKADEVYQRVYNYTNNSTISPVPGSNSEYELEVTDNKGRKVTGRAKFLPFVPIKEVEWKYGEDSLKAFLLVRFNDDPATEDYYRFQVHKDSLNKKADLDFNLNDTFKSGDEITIGTGYNYEYGDTVYVTVYHIEKKFNDFLDSVESAANANGNPFAQPARVKSTVEGGIGVFATLVYDRKKIIIE